MLTIVTDNGGPFRSFRFESFIAAHPELHHVRTRVKTPGQNGSRERGFGTLKYERLYLDEINDAIVLAERAEDADTVRRMPPVRFHLDGGRDRWDGGSAGLDGDTAGTDGSPAGTGADRIDSTWRDRT